MILRPDHITTKKQFVDALRTFVATDGTSVDATFNMSLGESMLMDAFATYLETATEIPNEELGISFGDRIHKYVIDAFELFHAHPRYEDLRKRYRAKLGEDLPSLTDIRGGYAHGRVTYDIIRLFPQLLGEMGRHIDRVLHGELRAEQIVIDHAWRRFVRECYGELYSKFKKLKRDLRGTFGRTTLEVGEGLGCLQFDFVRPDVLPEQQLLQRIIDVVGTEVTAQERIDALEALLMTRHEHAPHGKLQRITYTANSNEPIAQSAGINYPRTYYADCVAMINDVIDHWDIDKLKPTRRGH